jgi:hypothetical protein
MARRWLGPLLLLALAFALSTPPVWPGEAVLIPYGASGYRYQVVPFDGTAGFEAAGFDDAGFRVGAAPFGSLSTLCVPSGAVRTIWRENTDLLLRKAFLVPAWVRGVRVAVAIDNDVQVFLNGVEISRGLQASEGCVVRDRFVFEAPAGVVAPGALNLVAVRARDRGTIGYCDLEVRGGLAGPAPAGSTILSLESGRDEPGAPDLSLWVQGAEVPGLAAPSAGIPLQHPFAWEAPGWAPVPGARWVSPAQTGAGPPGGYEYFALFAVPPGARVARLDLLWLAEGASEVAVNGARLPARGAASEAPGEFRGEITPLLVPGLNRLQFFVANQGSGLRPTGLAFCAQVTFSP